MPDPILFPCIWQLSGGYQFPTNQWDNLTLDVVMWLIYLHRRFNVPNVVDASPDMPGFNDPF